MGSSCSTWLRYSLHGVGLVVRKSAHDAIRPSGFLQLHPPPLFARARVSPVGEISAPVTSMLGKVVTYSRIFESPKPCGTLYTLGSLRGWLFVKSRISPFKGSTAIASQPGKNMLMWICLISFDQITIFFPRQLWDTLGSLNLYIVWEDLSPMSAR